MTCMCVQLYFNVFLHFVFTARIEDMKQSLLNKIAELGKELPLNTLDELIDKFGGPDKVSEVRAIDIQQKRPELQMRHFSPPPVA